MVAMISKWRWLRVGARYISALVIFGGLAVSAYAANGMASDWSINFTALNQMMDKLSSNMPAVIRFIVAFAYVVGIWFVVVAVLELRVYGQARTMMPGNTSFTGPLSKFMIGVAMIFFPSIINLSMWTLWGQGTSSILVYPNTTDTQWQPLINGVISLIRVLGYISILRGLMMYTRAAQHGAQPGTGGKATVHIIGGVLAVNIVQTVKILNASLGL